MRRLAVPLLLVGPPMLALAVGFGLASVEFLRTGLCPAQPLDIPAQPCNAEEFVDAFFGGWSAIGLAVLTLAWLPVGVMLCLARWAVLAWLRSARRTIALQVGVGICVTAGALLLAAWSWLFDPVVSALAVFVGLAAFWSWSIRAGRAVG